jgi:hypothetical protein
MKKIPVVLLVWLLIISMIPGCSRTKNVWQLYSPDKQVRLDINSFSSGSGSSISYSVHVKRDGVFIPLTDESALGIEREDARFVEDLVLLTETYSMDQEDKYQLSTGKQLHCLARFNSLGLTFKNSDHEKISIKFRAYNDGIAFRYHFPGKKEHYVRVTREYTGFNFKEGNFWGHPYDTISTWTPAYETYYENAIPVGTEAPWNKNGWAFPILIESQGNWMLVSEAGLDGGYGASHLESRCTDGNYLIRFAEKTECEGYYENTSYSTLPWSTPWRFMVVGNNLNAIVESNLPTHLSDPSEISDPSWIRPGRATWSWWSDSDSPQEFDRLTPFVDFAAEMGWEYSLVDANWNRMNGGDLALLADYAEAKNVSLLVWYNSGGKHNVVPEEPRDLMDSREKRIEEFKRISELGIKGIKVDFFQSDKQEIIKQYLEILEDAAQYHLLVNFHGCTLPKGWRRTWPNLVTMEAVRGGECYKFDASYPEMAPAHLAILPFTRNVMGPVDYTPCGFTDHNHPHLTTYGFELALPVLFESGIMHYMDTPDKTRSLPAAVVDFLKEVPVVWDETRFITGYPGREVVMARRSGDTWFVAGINGENLNKEVVLDLSVTGSSPARVQLFTDGNARGVLEHRSVNVTDGKLTLTLQPYGGFTGVWE